ncbi:MULTISPECIES: hypothetical protein [unclassified Dysgonomonas]|uniref:hypothetical protein n=1 Tax=unclassified Dysgonomonas TaxID=2630389 RepID=UPI00067FC854|nr:MULTISPECIES: hypothetical protein [unclassified Dysgonomonas]MBD8346529.1 hypothetical protein [Dysgonomonas sp. HGC4]MBF0574555.1 hypothetical protein [Dysgonomonas sp. GY617]
MELPRFLIADNEEYPENTYVLHTEKPRFILDVDSEEFEILDGSEVEEEAMQDLIEQALGFYEAELDKYDEEDED